MCIGAGHIRLSGPPASAEFEAYFAAMAFHYPYGVRGYSLCAECLAPIDPSIAPLASTCKHRLCNKCWLGTLRKNGDSYTNNYCGGAVCLMRTAMPLSIAQSSLIPMAGSATTSTAGQQAQPAKRRPQYWRHYVEGIRLIETMLEDSVRLAVKSMSIAQPQDVVTAENTQALTAIAKRFNDSAFKPFIRFPNDLRLFKRAEPNLEPRRVVDPDEVYRRIQDIRRVYTKAVSSWSRSEFKSPTVDDFFTFCRDSQDDNDQHKTYWLDVYYLRHLVVQGYNQDVTKVFVDPTPAPQPDAGNQETSASPKPPDEERANKRAKPNEDGDENAKNAEDASTSEEAANRTNEQLKIAMVAIAESETARKQYFWSKSLLRATEALSNEKIPQEVKNIYERQVAYYSKLLDEAAGKDEGGEGASSTSAPPTT
eukprot:758780-Hanusia_phi.AAC.3